MTEKKKNQQTRDLWTTHDELEFIKKLKPNPSRIGSERFTRKELLEKYLAAMENRKVWTGIDPIIIRDMVMKEIQREG